MRWRVEGRPNRLEDNLWGFGIVRGRRSRQIRARVDAEVAKLRGGGPEELAVELVQSHLNDRVPPHEVALVPGWNYVRQEPAAGEMGFTNLRGIRMRWVHLAHRLNLPHWLQPRP
jgi:hypothetical protein